MSRDSRDAADFAADYALAQGLSADQATGLAQRLALTIDWLKAFRRALGYTVRYQGDPAQVRQALEGATEAAVRYTRVWGALRVVLRPDHCATPEGFKLPAAVETELHAHTFFPLFRDGVTALSLNPGLGLRELELLLHVIAARGRRDGDDAFTWIWSERLPGISVSVASSLTLRVAVAIADRQGTDPFLGAYLRTFEAAGPFDPGLESRSCFTTEHLDALVSQGLDPARAQALLAASDPEAALPPISDTASANIRAFFAHEPDRTARLSAMRERHLSRSRTS